MTSVHSEYAHRIKPPLLRLGEDLERKVYTPLVVCVKEQYSNFDSEPYVEWVYRRLNAVTRKIRFYYNVFVKPRIMKLLYQLKLDEYCYRIHNRIGPFLEKARFILHCLRPYTEKAKVSMEQGYRGLRKVYYQSSHWIGDGLISVRNSAERELVSTSESELETDTESESETENEEEESDEGEDYDDVETETLTSTVVVTMTLDDTNGVVASGTAKTETNNIEVSEQEMLQEEINAWYSLIDRQSRSLIKTFNDDADKFVDERIEVLAPELRNKTQVLSKKSQTEFQKITRAIQDINCTTSIYPKTGEIIYFDRSGTTKLSQYITRPLMRQMFNETKTELEAMVLEIQSDLKNLTDEVEKKVKVIREDILEVYEEWGDVMISEWSKRLAYIDVIAGHLENSEKSSTTSSDNWKKFLKLKKQVISQRDELASKPAELKVMKEFVNKVEYILSIITKESGEYTYILRSRANLAFQEREKQERENFRLEQLAQQNAEEAREALAQEQGQEQGQDQEQGQGQVRAQIQDHAGQAPLIEEFKESHA